MFATLGFPEDGVDFLNSCHQLSSMGFAHFHLACGAQLSCFPEGVVQVGVLLQGERA